MMGGAETLGAVFDDRDVMFFGNGVDAGHVRALAVDGDRHDGFGVGGDDRFDQFRVHIESVRLDVTNTGLALSNAMTSAVEIQV